jgi:ferredoxin
VKVRGRFRLGDGDRIFAGRQVLRFDDERQNEQPSTRVTITAKSAAAAMAEPGQAESPPAARPAPPPIARRPDAAPAQPAGPLVILSDGRRAPCMKGQTILEAAKKNDIKIRYECGAGQCGIDPVEILGGGEALNEIGNIERDVLEDLCSLQPGRYRLACMARVIQDAAVSINVINT